MIKWTTQLPPELLTPEERTARATELDRAIGREWLHYAIIDGGVLGTGVFALFVVHQTTDVISDRVYYGLLGAGAFATAVLLAYYFTIRIRPLAKEREALRALDPELEQAQGSAPGEGDSDPYSR